jgi:hypothetical protein
MMGNTSCNKCLRSPSSSTFITMSVCVGGSYDSIVLKWKTFILKVLLGWTFTKFIVIALGVEFCSIGIAGRGVVFSHIGVGSMIADDLKGRK